MRILFMGTPDFALGILRSLTEAGENVVGTVTRTDKPSGRGHRLTASPVKEYSLEHGIPCLQPTTLRGDAFAGQLEELAPDLIIVASFGMILPPNVIDYPKYGCVNVHASLLPEYRGAAPIQRAIIDGRKVTGVTVMMMEAGLDTGDMLLKKEVEITDGDDFGTLHDKLCAAGAEALAEALRLMRKGELVRTPQSESDVEPTYASKITEAEQLIDFSQSPRAILDLIRGLSPSPYAFTHTPAGRLLKITSARPAPDGEPETPGRVVSVKGGAVTVACGDGRGRIAVTGVIPAGRGKMDAAAFANGRGTVPGDLLS
ncbi:MAG: methionyl-tRNA formyltransferase [Clostridia bacterium]|nr:methionyl-tRNA formyltransferase [Clostridia bacterium]